MSRPRHAPIAPLPRIIAGAALSLVLVLSGTIVSLAQEDGGPLTVYSGRSESLVGPVLASFTEASGIEVEVKYADTAELAAILLEEGSRSPADIFFAQDAGALGAVAAAGLLDQLPEDLLARVPAAFRDAQGHWVGISGRARTVAYSTAEELTMPASILEFTAPEWSGRIGWAPANGSFQSFVTALRATEGEEAAKDWLEGVLANDAVDYASNTAAVEGVAAGEVDVAFVNHYYLLRLLAEQGDDYPVAQHFFAGGDPGALVNVAGIARLATSDQPEAATALIDYLLGAEAQAYFSEQTYEYPLIEGIVADPRLPELATIDAPEVDLAELADLQGTVELLREVGAID
jgi:iron(III) transport system substrate-binding protein